MVLVGYPDWERVQREGGDLVALSNTIITVSTELGPFNVQQWKSIRVQVNSANNADFQTIAANWYDTVTKANLLSVSTFTVRPGDSFGLAIPIQGPYLDIIITPETGTATAPFKISIAGIRTVPSNYQMLPSSVPLISDSHSYALSASMAFQPPIFYGNVTFHIAPAANPTGLIDISRFDLVANTFIKMYQWQSILVAAPLTVTISLPLAAIKVIVNNGAVGAQLITTTLMPAPP
jgi:hypothetical protein